MYLGRVVVVIYFGLDDEDPCEEDRPVVCVCCCILCRAVVGLFGAIALHAQTWGNGVAVVVDRRLCALDVGISQACDLMVKPDVCLALAAGLAMFDHARVVRVARLVPVTSHSRVVRMLRGLPSPAHRV